MDECCAVCGYIPSWFEDLPHCPQCGEVICDRCKNDQGLCPNCAELEDNESGR